MEPSPELTDAIIEAAMLRAEQAVCPRDDARRYGFPWSAAIALSQCTPAGWCDIGFVVTGGGRDRWTAWYNVHTGEGRLKKDTGKR